MAPTVKLNIQGAATAVDMRYGNGGLGGYGDIPANEEAGRGRSDDHQGSGDHGRGDGRGEDDDQ